MSYFIHLLVSFVLQLPERELHKGHPCNRFGIHTQSRRFHPRTRHSSYSSDSHSHQYLHRKDQFAPTGVYYQVHLLNYITISWTPPLDPTGLTGYVTQYTAGGMERNELIEDPTVTTITLQDVNLAGVLDGVFLAPFVNGEISVNGITQGDPAPPEALPPAPTSPTIQQTSDTSYTLSWGNPGNIDGYVISYAQGPGVGTSIELPIDRTSEQIFNLTPNTDYVFNLYSQRNGIRTQAQLVVLPPIVTPPEDTVITINELGEDFINIVWDHDPTQGILSYVVTLFASDGTTKVINEQPLNPMTSMTHRFSGLTPGTEYVIDIDIITAASPLSDFTSQSQFTRPKPPRNVFLYQLSDSAILFRWQPPLSPNNFFIDYLVFAENADTGISQENILPQGASSNAIRGLQSGANYNLGVFTNIEPITSVLADFTVVPLVGSAGDVTIGAVTAQELEVIWTSQGIDAQTFIVRLFSEDGTQEYMQTVQAGTASAICENLTPDTPYIAVVEAITTAGSSTTVGSDSATTNTLPDSTSVIVDSTTATSAALSWTAVPAATGYIISYISQDRSDTGTFISSGSGTTATVPGLKPQTTYTFSVVGTDGTDVTNVGTAVGTTAPVTDTRLPETTDPLTQSTALTPRPVTTTKPKAAINYTVYIVMTAVVLLLILVICFLLCYVKRKKSTSVRKRTSSLTDQTDASTDAKSSVELRPLPLKPASRQYDARIERTAAGENRSDEGQLTHTYAEQPHTYMDIL